MIVDGKKETGTFSESFDYVIVGSGAAGATVARVLADTGATIAVVEEGPAIDASAFGDRMYPAMRDMFRDMGAQVARGRTFIPVIQGRGLGGSTVINSAIVWRMPDDVWEPWATEHGLGAALPLEDLHRHWDQIERETAVTRTPAPVWGRNNSVIDDAVREMGLSGAATRRNVHMCRGSARCQLGCPFGAKQSMLNTYLPYARERGATLIANAPVQRVTMEGDRAVAVEGRFHAGPGRKKGERFSIRAGKAVIVAASAIQTPGVLQRSGVRSRHLGAHFQAHPGVPVMGLFDEPVDMWWGATQGYDVDHHRIDLRFKIESLSLPPETVFARLPGVGATWLENMARSGHMTSWAVQMRASAEGSIRERVFGTDIRFDLNRLDMDNIRRGIRFSAEMLFVAGAREVMAGVYGMPPVITSIDQAAQFETGPADPRAYAVVMSHMFGTARMGVDERNGVVGPDFAVHGTKNFYVVDSSVFPTNTGVNPQHPIMGVAMHAGEKLALSA